MENWGFDGLDLSFEFPQINERKGFATWIKKIKEAFGTKYELTISLPANKEKIQAGKVGSKVTNNYLLNSMLVFGQKSI